MPEQSCFLAGAVADDHILRAENRACNVTAVMAAEYFNQIVMPFKIARDLLDKAQALHKTPRTFIKKQAT